MLLERVGLKECKHYSGPLFTETPSRVLLGNRTSSVSQSVPEISFREELPFPQGKAAGWSLEARVVDRDLTVTQVNNCKRLERQFGLGKQFCNSRRPL